LGGIPPYKKGSFHVCKACRAYNFISGLEEIIGLALNGICPEVKVNDDQGFCMPLNEDKN
jgi:hypothetical protein